jgi:hypothetical protein
MEGRRFGWGITSPLPSAAHPINTKKKKEESKSNSQNHLREPTADSTMSSSFDMPHSPSSTHGGAGGGGGHRQFSGLSGISYSPPSSNSSSSIHGGFSSNIQTYNNGGTDNGVSSSSNIATTTTTNTTVNNLKKRQSFGRLSKLSSSGSSNDSRTNFQKYPAVLVAANSNSLTPPLELKDLPNDRTWSGLDTKFGIDESIREQASPFGGTFGDIVDQTSRKRVTMSVVEEKFYHTWHFGRTVLLGDCKLLLIFFFLGVRWYGGKEIVPNHRFPPFFLSLACLYVISLSFNQLATRYVFHELFSSTRLFQLFFSRITKESNSQLRPHHH